MSLKSCLSLSQGILSKKIVCITGLDSLLPALWVYLLMGRGVSLSIACLPYMTHGPSAQRGRILDSEVAKSSCSNDPLADEKTFFFTTVTLPAPDNTLITVLSHSAHLENKIRNQVNSLESCYINLTYTKQARQSASFP